MSEKTAHPDSPQGGRLAAIESVKPCVLLGVSGGVAAYKAVDLASKLTSLGAAVKTVMTENACRFVGAKSFEAVTCSAVYTSMWSDPAEHNDSHIGLVDWCDILVIAPATANIIGKAAAGICDDLLSTIFCAAWGKAILLAPAMNRNMWGSPAVQRNVGALKEIGVEMTGPVEGRLANGDIGIGRMAEPRDIMFAIDTIVSRIKKSEK